MGCASWRAILPGHSHLVNRRGASASFPCKEFRSQPLVTGNLRQLYKCCITMQCTGAGELPGSFLPTHPRQPGDCGRYAMKARTLLLSSEPNTHTLCAPFQFLDRYLFNEFPRPYQTQVDRTDACTSIFGSSAGNCCRGCTVATVI